MPRVSLQWSEFGTELGEDGGDEASLTFRSVTFDAVTAQQRDASVDLPAQPVEGGSDETDHVITKPREVSFQAHLSYAVFDEDLTNGGGATRTASRNNVDVGNDQQARVISAIAPPDRVREVLDQLYELMDSGSEVDVIGLLYGDLEGYQIASITMAQDQATGLRADPVVTVRQRLTASVEEVDAPAPRVERTRRRRDQGQRDAQPQGDPATQRDRTSARVLQDLAAGLVGGGS